MQIRKISKAKGLGDTVENVLKAIYIDKIADAISNGLGVDDCGCSKRKDALNNPNLFINKKFYGTK